MLQAPITFQKTGSKSIFLIPSSLAWTDIDPARRDSSQNHLFCHLHANPSESEDCEKIQNEMELHFYTFFPKVPRKNVELFSTRNF